MLIIIVILFGLLSVGCINVSISTQPENLAIQELREASDCVPNILGLSFGHASIEGALNEPAPLVKSDQAFPVKGQKVVDRPAAQKIAKIRRVQIHDYMFLLFGAKCVEVVGE